MRGERQRLAVFKVEAWKLRDDGIRRYCADRAEVFALDGYGAACYCAASWGYSQLEWHDIDGGGKPPVVIRVTETKEKL